MSVKMLDQDYVSELIDRLRVIPPDTRPAWGTLTPQGLAAHLVAVVRYSMGRSGVLPVVSSPFTRRIIGPLIMYGILRLPKNVKAPRSSGARPASSSDDLETLQALLEECLQLVQADELNPPPHLFFGDIGIDGWARMHVVHFEHHLRQFRA